MIYRPRTRPKLSALCDIDSHLVLGLTVNRGPKPDHCEFESTLRDALRRQPMKTLIADAGYDSEKAHRLCRDQLGCKFSTEAFDVEAAF